MSVVFPTSLRSLETAEASTSEADRHECWVNSSLEPGGGTWAEVRVLMASGDACLSYQLFNRKSLNMYCELCTRHWLAGTWECIRSKHNTKCYPWGCLARGNRLHNKLHRLVCRKQRERQSLEAPKLHVFILNPFPPVTISELFGLFLIICIKTCIKYV